MTALLVGDATAGASSVPATTRVFGNRTGYLSPRNASSDMAVSRQVSTASITGRDGASKRMGHLTNGQSDALTIPSTDLRCT
jgi:hypothetical protein